MHRGVVKVGFQDLSIVFKAAFIFYKHLLSMKKLLSRVRNL